MRIRRILITWINLILDKINCSLLHVRMPLNPPFSMVKLEKESFTDGNAFNYYSVGFGFGCVCGGGCLELGSR